MTESLQFFYEKEYWYMSAIINTGYIDCDKKVKEIEELIKKKIINLTDTDLKKISWNKPWLEKVKDIGKNMSIKCNWIPFIESFPYSDENLGLKYDTLGYIEFEVEYYKGNPDKKKNIEPVYIQQIPIVISNELKKFRTKIDNQYFNLDLESPIFIFVIADEMLPNDIKWTQENILKYKKVLGTWTEIYSGQWDDYTEKLYNGRVRNNLSNRLSELHFIRRNSGLIYMAPENYGRFFQSYIIENVLRPTAKIRSIVYALMSFNKSLDTLFVMKNFMDTDILEKKIKNLTFLRGVIQTQMSLIYDELDYNRRQHYTKVLSHLISEFTLNRLLDRINNKFDVIHSSIDLIYQQMNEENQAKTQRGMTVLNLLFSLGILIDIAAAIEISRLAFINSEFFSAIFQGTIGTILGSVLIIISIYLVKLKLESNRKKIRKTVDAVIVDRKMENIVLINRKYPPCAGQLALPGGFIEHKESPKEALIREVKEETGLDITVERKIGYYDKKGRDPRGLIESTAFLCFIDGEISDMECSDESTSVEFIPIYDLKGIDLAFDHEDIINDVLHIGD